MINKVTEETRKKILNKSAYGMPNNPSELGWSAEKIKRNLHSGFTDNENSVLSEIDRLAEEINSELTDIGNYENLLRVADIGTKVPSLVNGKIPAAFIPGYFDDVIDGKYISETEFSVGGELIELESGKIYIDDEKGVAYRFGGTKLTSIGSGLTLGETSITAFDGARGKQAYEHISSKNNPHGVTAKQVGAELAGTASRLLDAHNEDVEAHPNLVSHIANKLNPHGTTAEQVGADTAGTASRLLDAHNSSNSAHQDIRDLIGSKIDKTGGVLTGDIATNNVLPNATKTYDLGSDNLRFNKIFSDELSLSGSATIGKDLHVLGKVVAEGGMVVSVTEEVRTENDYITLRDGAKTGLADGAKTGIRAKLYDGVTDGYLSFDSNGVARVGDAGDEQPLATRNESEYMTSGNVVYWDAATQKLKTGLVAAADIAKKGDLPTSLPASDVYAWAKQSTKPKYTLDEIQGADSLLKDADIQEWAKADVKPTYTYDEILNAPNALPASDVYPWAKAETKPTYNYSEIVGTPTIPASQVQADYDETDATKMSYIKNKPTKIVSYAEQVLSQDEQAQARANIGAGTSNFDGQYSSLTGAPTSLPASDVYMWAKSENKPTYKYSEIVGAPQNVSELNFDLNLVEDKNYVHTDNNFTNAYKQKIDDTANSLAQIDFDNICKIEQIEQNGTLLPITNKKVSITTPTLLSELADDAQHRLVSDDNITSWNGKLTRAQADNVYLKLSGGTITGDLHIAGNITQAGASYTTHAEEVYSTNDRIILRDGAVSGLTANEYAGLTAKKYDGTNDGALVFDNEGVARVGDVGDEQPLATRGESSEMTNGKFVNWNATNNRIETKEITFSDLPNFDTKYVSFVNASQNLSNEQKGYARANIGAVASNATIESNSEALIFPSYDEKGLITGKVSEAKKKKLYLNGQEQEIYGSNATQLNLYAPATAGTEGQILKSNGSGAPVWVTLGESDIPDLSSLYLTSIPKATSTTVGGLLADEKTTSETEEVKIDSTTGKLYAKTIPTSLPASDVYPWAKAAAKPTYTANEVGAMPSDKQVLLYAEQSLTPAQQTQARTNIGAGTSNFDGQYSSLTGVPTIPTDNVSLANGAGYITIDSLANYLKFVEQSLSTEQQAQARANIGAGTSSFSGNYSDLTNKPTEATTTKSGFMSSSDKTKLNGIASGAEANTINAIKKNGTALSITNKVVDISVPTSVSDLVNNGDGTSPFATEDYVAQRTSGVYHYKGSVNSYSDLPTQNLTVGDTYNVVQEFDNHPAGTNVSWNGEKWDALGGAFDLTKFYDKTEIDNMCLKYSVNQNLAEEYKQIARNNLGITDAIVGASVLYSESQSLTDAQKEIARDNIGAISFADLDDFLAGQTEHSGNGLLISRNNSGITIQTQRVYDNTSSVSRVAPLPSENISLIAYGDIFFNRRPIILNDEHIQSDQVALCSDMSEVIKYVAQSLTETQKAQARSNIGAGASSFSGSYNDLTNKPTLFSGNYNDLTNKPSNATQSAAGFMSASDKTKLDDLKSSATVSVTQLWNGTGTGSHTVDNLTNYQFVFARFKSSASEYVSQFMPVSQIPSSTNIYMNASGASNTRYVLWQKTSNTTINITKVSAASEFILYGVKVV